MRSWWCCGAKPARRGKNARQRAPDRVESARGPALTAPGGHRTGSAGPTPPLVTISASASGVRAALPPAAAQASSALRLLSSASSPTRAQLACPDGYRLGAAAPTPASAETTHRTSRGRSPVGARRDAVGRPDRLLLAGTARALRSVVDGGQPLSALVERGSVDPDRAGLITPESFCLRVRSPSLSGTVVLVLNTARAGGRFHNV
jgi:hypothetical protein